MRRTLEAIFRHLFQLLALLILLPVIGVGVVYVATPKKYQSTASLWALQRYVVIGATGPETNLTATPADTQATAVDELLQTRSFVLTVVQGIDLVPTLHLSQSVLNDPQQTQDAIFAELSKNVQATAQGYNLFEITYSNLNPRVAQQIVQAVVTNYEAQSLTFSVAEGQNLMASYQAELQKAQQDENTAIAAETQYQLAHPNAKLATDPQYQQLDSARIQTQNNVTNLQNQINTLQQAISSQNSGKNTLYDVVDAPQLPTRAQSRTKEYLVGGGGGLAVALLTSILFLVILVRRDRTIYSAYDLQGASLGVPVVMQWPQLKPAVVSLITVREAGEQPLALARKSSANGRVAQ